MLSHIRIPRARPGGAPRCRHRRRSCALLALLLLTALLFPASALGEQPWQSMQMVGDVSVARTLKRVSADSYDYYIYVQSHLPEGYLGGTFRDLDGDNQLEYVVVYAGADNDVFLRIYERDDRYQWAVAADEKLYSSEFDCNIEAHDVFLKQVGGRYLICNENWRRESAIADGASWIFSIYEYKGNHPLTSTTLYVEGTDVSGDLSSWLNDAYYAENYPQLATYARTLLDCRLNIRKIYWNNMICEQDTSLDVLSRVYSGYDMSEETIADFIASNGSELKGFYTRTINCVRNDFRVPEDSYLSTHYDGERPSPAEDASGSMDAAELESSFTYQYVIADSDTRLLTIEELSQYDRDTLALIRNEILARHGYPFQKRKYREYFEAQAWYQRDENFTYGSLNSTEMQNVEVIKRLENQ